jgi:hypothetical protein
MDLKYILFILFVCSSCSNSSEFRNGKKSKDEGKVTSSNASSNSNTIASSDSTETSRNLPNKEGEISVVIETDVSSVEVKNFTTTCNPWAKGRPMSADFGTGNLHYFFGTGKTRNQCQAECKSWIQKNGAPGSQYTCPRHSNSDCHGVVVGHHSTPNGGGCSGCETSFCSTSS